MVKFRLIHKHLFIDKPSKDVTTAISNGLNAFTASISYSLSSSDRELFVLKLTEQTTYKALDSYITIIIEATNQNQAQTELEFLLCYRSDESIFKAWFQKRKIKRAFNSFMEDFKRKCEKWL